MLKYEWNNFKYGWVRIYTPEIISGDPFYVYDYAFETTPNTPILAGAVTSAVAGDANGDGRVDVSDLGIIAANYGRTSGAFRYQGDFNGDRRVDVSDLGVIAANYGFGTGAAADFNQDTQAFDLIVKDAKVASEVVQLQKAEQNVDTNLLGLGGCGSGSLILITFILATLWSFACIKN